MTVKISVILTVYNTEKYLSECLESILHQSLTNFELICINDASTDNSLTILSEYTEKDFRICVYDMPENKGVSYCRNFGFSKAQGEYVIFLDSDDYFKLTMFQEMYELAKQDDADIAICNSMKYDDVLDEMLFMEDSLRVDYLTKKEGFNYTTCPNYILNFCKGWAWDKLYKKEFLEENHLQFPALSNTEDAVFVYSSLVLAERISIIDSVFVVHRIRRKDSISNRHDSNFYEFIKAMGLLREFLEKENLFQAVSKSYANLVVNLGLWYFNTLKDKGNRKEMYEILHNELFLALSSQCKLYSKEDFYVPSDYLQFKQILKKPYTEKQDKKIKIHYVLTRGLKSLRENGITYWIKRGLHN